VFGLLPNYNEPPSMGENLGESRGSWEITWRDGMGVVEIETLALFILF